MKQFVTVRMLVAALMLLLPILDIVADDYVPLSNTVRKLKSGSLRVAVIGDSIGWGQGVQSAVIQGVCYGTRVKFNQKNSPRGNPMGYARTTTDYVKKIAAEKFGVSDSHIETFYAVWGGATTFTSFGYVPMDIIARKPDLVFYQIWNPGGKEALRYAELTLRAIWKSLPETDIILLSVGGLFSNPQIVNPLREKYKTPYINAVAEIDCHFRKFGSKSVLPYSTVHYLTADGSLSGAMNYIYCHSAPHVSEEGYAIFNDVISKELDGWFDAVKDAKGVCSRVPPAGSIESELIESEGEICLSSRIVRPSDFAFDDPGGWKTETHEKDDEPMDTMDRAVSEKIVALKEGAIARTRVVGRFLLFRNASGVKISIDGGVTFVAIRDGQKLTLGESGDVEAEVVVKAHRKGGSVNEFYVYCENCQTIKERPSKHRWSVKYFAKVQSTFVHDWHLKGEQVLPHPLRWLNVYRDETFGKPVVVPDETVIHSDCERNGEFLGWVEADAVEWDGGERLPTVNTHTGRKIYKPREKIDIATIGRDLTLVAAFSKGPLPTGYVRTIKASFVTENNGAYGKAVAILDVPEKNPVVTLPELPKCKFYKANGWKIVNSNKLLQPGEKVTLATDTEFVVDWSLDEKDMTGIRKDGMKTVVDFSKRCGELEKMFFSEVNGTVWSKVVSRKVDGSLIVHGHNFNHLVSFSDKGLRAELISSEGWWCSPTFSGVVVVPLRLSEIKKVSLRYSYASKASVNLSGQHMTLSLFCTSADGFGGDRVNIVSEGTIAVGENLGISFVLPAADNTSIIRWLELKPYDTTPQLRAQKQGWKNGDILTIGEFAFE